MLDYIKRLAGPYTGEGETTFSFGFKVFEPTDVYVAVASSDQGSATTLVYGSDYSVELNDDQEATPGGSVTVVSPLVSGEILVVGSAVDYTQEVQLTNYSRFPPSIINDALDRIVMQIQQLVERIGRAITVPATSSSTVDEIYERLITAAEKAETALALSEETIAAAEAVQTALDEAGDVTGAVPVAAAGTTEPRTIAEHFADVTNAKNFGAAGDGTTDDTAALAAATAVSNSVFLPAGTYAVGSVDEGKLYGDGILKYESGKEIAVESVGHFENLRQLVLGELKPAARYVVQDLSFCDGSIFFSQQTGAGSGSWTDSARVTISQFAFSPDTSWQVDLSDDSRGITPDSYVTLTGICGHGEACRAAKINGETYVFTQSTQQPTGYAKIRWQGADTTASDVTAYGALQYVNHPMIALTPDAKYILFCSTTGTSTGANGVSQGWQIAVYDREQVESAEDPSAVSPVDYWVAPWRNFDSSRSGFETDGKYVYILVSKADAGIGTQNVVDVYSMSGVFVRQILIDPVVAAIPNQYLYGKDGNYVGYREQEGLFLYRDMLCLCSKQSIFAPGGACTYQGRTYFSKIATTGVCPAFAENWSPTLATIDGATEYDAATTYAAPTLTAYIQALVAIAPSGRYSPDYPLNSTQLSPSKAHVEAGERARISSGEGAEVSLATKYNNLRQHVDMLRVLSDGSVQVHNAQWRVQNLTLTRYGELYFDPAENTFWLGTSANPRTFRIGSVIQSLVNFFVNKTSPAIYLVNSDVTSAEAPASSKPGMFRKITSDGTTLGHVMFENATASGMATLYINQPWSSLNAAVRLLASTTVGKQFYPTTSGDISLGRSEQLWSQVYASTSSISTSDERLKQDIEGIPEAVFRAWAKVEFVQFRFKDAVAKKGDGARIHIGAIAQRIKTAFESEGLDPFAYGLLCYDRWDASPAEIDPKTGEEIVPALEAGDRYSIRYEEALALECAYQRWRLAQIEARLGDA